MMTRFGNLTFAIPQVRAMEGAGAGRDGDGFYPSALTKGSRTDQAVNLMPAEMYVQGVSTRKVIGVLQKLAGPEVSISSTQVNRATARLDDVRRDVSWPVDMIVCTIHTHE